MKAAFKRQKEVHRHQLTLRNWSAESVRVSRESRLALADWGVVLDKTVRIGSALSWARVHTLLSVASLVCRTLSIDDALGPAVGRRPLVSLFTAAGCLVTDHATDGVGSALIGRTGISVDWLRHNLQSAATIRVADKAWQTVAHWVVIDGTTLCVLSANAWTGVHTLAVDACLVRLTLGGRDTLGPTASCGITLVLRQTNAHRNAVGLAALRVRSARIRIARV